jgi:release factor glutamine methyltransferase
MGNEVTLKQIVDDVTHRLAGIYGQREAQWMVRIILENVKGYSPVDVVLHRDEVLSDFIVGKIEDVTNRLLKNEPIQYIFGSARFYGNSLKVTHATLIPRPETEELVALIDKENRETDLRVLDVGTGSGCIAVTLARVLRFPIVDAIDISDDALAVAQENAQSLRVNVNFKKGDALAMEMPKTPIYDIIVSNPPYIADKEREDMSQNVLQYEPHTALFVPDNDPLRFYRAIGDYGTKALKGGGRLYFEINPLYVEEMRAMLDAMGYKEIRVVRDLPGKERMMVAVKP